MGDLNGNIIYEAEREAEMETWMNNLHDQAVHEIREMMRKIHSLPDIQKDEDALGQAITYVVGTYDGLKKIGDVMSFVEAVLDSGECPQLRPIDDDLYIKNFSARKEEADDGE